MRVKSEGMPVSEDAATSVGEPAERAGVRGGLFAIAAVTGAVAAASCCVVPFVLFTLGISGAWIASLAAAGPFQPLALAVSLAALLAGFLTVYGRRPKSACEAGFCAATPARRLTKAGLWFAAATAALALAWPLLARLFIEA